MRLTRFHLFVAFAFTVMADPVSSVAYAIEAALRALDGDLGDLVLTMALIVGTIALISATYHQLINRYPSGGAGPKAVAAAFGEGWAFLPLAALLVDFTLTVAVSCAAGSAALIAYAPGLAGSQTIIAVGLVVAVAGGISLGHGGRIFFATATLLFIGVAALVVLQGLFADPVTGPGAPGGQSPFAGAAFGAALLAMPLGMALATGVEAPSDAIAQLPQLHDRGRRLFGQLTVWLMVAIVGSLTLAFSVLAVTLGIGLPGADSTLLADVARQASGGDVTFAAFQMLSTLLLLAAAASSYLAASGVLKALALVGGEGRGLVNRRFGVVNRFLIPPWGIAAVMVASLVLVVAAGGDEQQIVHFYAVAVFASFLAALVGCARLSYFDRKRSAFAVNIAGAAVVAFVLALNLRRGDAIIALAATAAVATYLWRAWVARGRPHGIAEVVGQHARSATST